MTFNIGDNVKFRAGEWSNFCRIGGVEPKWCRVNNVYMACVEFLDVVTDEGRCISGVFASRFEPYVEATDVEWKLAYCAEHDRYNSKCLDMSIQTGQIKTLEKEIKLQRERIAELELANDKARMARDDCHTTLSKLIQHLGAVGVDTSGAPVYGSDPPKGDRKIAYQYLDLLSALSRIGIGVVNNNPFHYGSHEDKLRAAFEQLSKRFTESELKYKKLIDSITALCK